MAPVKATVIIMVVYLTKQHVFIIQKVSYKGIVCLNNAILGGNIEDCCRS